MSRSLSSLLSLEIILEKVAEITLKIQRCCELESLLPWALADIRTLLQTDRVLLYRFLENQASVVAFESIGAKCTPLLGQPFDGSCFDTIWLKRYQQGETTLVADRHNGALTPSAVQWLERFQVKAHLAVPLVSGGKLWGVLMAHHCCSPREWQPLEVQYLQQVALPLGLAIQQAALQACGTVDQTLEPLQQQQTQLELAERQRAEAALHQLNQAPEQRVQERTEALQKQAEQERVLRLVTRRIHVSFNLEEILETALAASRQTLLADRVAIYRFHPDWSGSFIAESVDASWVPLVGSKVQRIWEDTYLQQTQGGRYQHGKTFAVDDIYTVGHKQCHLDLLEQFQARAYAIVPIFVHDTLWGLLAAYQNVTPRHWQGEDVELLSQIAIHVAIAIQQSTLYQTAQAQVKELEQLNQIKDDFLSTVSHELRSPMTNIKMATQMLEIQLARTGVMDSAGTSPISRYFNILKEQSEREIQLINDLLDLTRLDADTEPLTLTSLCLGPWVEHLTRPFIERTQQQKQQLQLEIPSDLELETDFSYLERVLAELLHNACKYTPAGETIWITAHPVERATTLKPSPRSQQTQAVVQMCVSNSGVEIPPEEYDRIFAKFYRIPKNDPWKHGGTGLGLALVKKLAERLGASIHVVSGDGQTTFVLTFESDGIAAEASHP